MEMKIFLKSENIKKLVSKIISKKIEKETKLKPELNVNDLVLETAGNKSHIKIDCDIETDVMIGIISKILKE